MTLPIVIIRNCNAKVHHQQIQVINKLLFNHILWYLIRPRSPKNQKFNFEKKQNGQDLCSIPRSCYDRRVSFYFFVTNRTDRHRKSCHQIYFFILASTSTPKLPLSPRPNLMPFPSRETASATKCYRLWSPSNHALFQSFSGIRFLTIVLYIYSGNNRFKKLKQNTQFVRFYLVNTFVHEDSLPTVSFI